MNERVETIYSHIHDPQRWLPQLKKLQKTRPSFLLTLDDTKVHGTNASNNKKFLPLHKSEDILV